MKLKAYRKDIVSSRNFKLTMNFLYSKEKLNLISIFFSKWIDLDKLKRWWEIKNSKKTSITLRCCFIFGGRMIILCL